MGAWVYRNEDKARRNLADCRVVQRQRQQQRLRLVSVFASRRQQHEASQPDTARRLRKVVLWQPSNRLETGNWLALADYKFYKSRLQLLHEGPNRFIIVTL